MDKSNDKTKNKIKLGICAMEKKVYSKHMQNILNLLPQQEISIIIFKENIIFDKPIEEWPIVDALIIFFSDGFPYKKGLKYVNYRNPFLINDFEMQKIFWDRRKIVSILEEEKILVPNYIIVDRGEIIDNDGENKNTLNKSAEIEKQIQSFHEELENEENEENEENKKRENEKNENFELSNEENTNNSNETNENNIFEEENEPQTPKKNSKNDLIEYDDHIEYKGKKLFKPFVEKPSNGDDHFVYIYYPPNHGGGSKRLFRKTKNECSLFFPKVNKIRRDKSYIYEEFLQTDGFDIKVYTIGPEYTHAEARKSPTLDGIVQRSSDGKEIRYPVNLTPQEKEFAFKIVKRFKQNICGFDILRYNGKSYVCDVNGWSFVKGNKKYYQACAFYIWKMIGEKFGLNLILEKSIYLIKDPVYNNLKLTNNNNGNNNKKYEEELRSVVAIFRHADRSPKQKMKVVVYNKEILSLFDIYNKENNNENPKKNKEKKQKEIKLKKPKELMTVLKLVTKILKNKNIISSLNDSNDDFFTKLFQIKMVLEKNTNFEGMTRKIQLKPLEYDTETLKVKKALLILKWGGTITHSGIEQAKLLGNTFRIQIYPSSLDGGILRLHSTYRHDLKCYSAEEGRCLKTAASFLKGLLQFNEPITPIITSMVSKDENISNALDITNEQIPEVKGNIKHEISDCLNFNGNISEKFNQMFNKDSIYPDIVLDKTNKNEDVKNFYFKYPVYGVMDKIDNGYERMKIILNLIDNFLEHLKNFLNDEDRVDSDTYFIKNASSMGKRNKFFKDYLNLSKNENLKDEIEKIKKQSSIKKKHSLKTPTENPEIKKEKIIVKQDNDSIPECEEEKEILIYKRYKKLRLDFYNKKTNKFDVTKIPDIYDNIKYDIIHNKHILDKNSNFLYENILLISNFLMPFEYGITIKEKIDIGLRIIKPLMNKIYKDLIWWNYNNPYFENNNDMKETNWSGLDQNKVDPSEIKSAWRHIKTRFYFTCASHMYALINLLIYGDNSFLLGDNKNTLYELRNIFDLDYCSHVVFRLYENFNVNLDDSKRFRLEIFMSPGSSKDPREADDNHLINVSSWIVLNNNLTLQQMKEFFSQFIDIEKEELNNKN